MQEHITEGIICVDDKYGFTYNVSKIEYIEWEDETYEFAFMPNYSVISLLKPDIFQGIPGLDLELKKEKYIRKNKIPIFISERAPMKNRENLYELLEECGMNYWNPLEWLIRTDTQYFGDKLYVRGVDETVKPLTVNSISEIGTRSADICKKLLEQICAGNVITTDEVKMDDNNRLQAYYLLMSLYSKEKNYINNQQRKGIKNAVTQGKYKGRKRINLDSIKLQEIFENYAEKKISCEQAIELLDISRSTFMRRYAEYRKKVKNALQ